MFISLLSSVECVVKRKMGFMYCTPKNTIRNCCHLWILSLVLMRQLSKCCMRTEIHLHVQIPSYVYYRFISISTPSIPSKHTHIFPSTSENIRKNSFIIMMLHSHNQLTFMSEVFPWQKKNVPEKTFSFWCLARVWEKFLPAANAKTA